MRIEPNVNSFLRFAWCFKVYQCQLRADVQSIVSVHLVSNFSEKNIHSFNQPKSTSSKLFFYFSRQATDISSLWTFLSLERWEVLTCLFPFLETGGQHVWAKNSPSPNFKKDSGKGIYVTSLDFFNIVWSFDDAILSLTPARGQTNLWHFYFFVS